MAFDFNGKSFGSRNDMYYGGKDIYMWDFYFLNGFILFTIYSTLGLKVDHLLSLRSKENRLFPLVLQTQQCHLCS